MIINGEYLDGNVEVLDVSEAIEQAAEGRQCLEPIGYPVQVWQKYSKPQDWTLISKLWKIQNKSIQADSTVATFMNGVLYVCGGNGYYPNRSDRYFTFQTSM